MCTKLKSWHGNADEWKTKVHRRSKNWTQMNAETWKIWTMVKRTIGVLLIFRFSAFSHSEQCMRMYIPSIHSVCSMIFSHRRFVVVEKVNEMYPRMYICKNEELPAIGTSNGKVMNAIRIRRRQRRCQRKRQPYNLWARNEIERGSKYFNAIRSPRNMTKPIKQILFRSHATISNILIWKFLLHWLHTNGMAATLPRKGCREKSKWVCVCVLHIYTRIWSRFLIQVNSSGWEFLWLYYESWCTLCICSFWVTYSEHINQAYNKIDYPQSHQQHSYKRNVIWHTDVISMTRINCHVHIDSPKRLQFKNVNLIVVCSRLVVSMKSFAPSLSQRRFAIFFSWHPTYAYLYDGPLW